MKKDLSRRDFLKGAAAGAVGIAAAGILSGCGNADEKTSPTPATTPTPTPVPPAEKWDMAADFVVVGGGTGLGGAVAAAAEGMSVIVLEKRGSVGGAMALSGGVSWIPNNVHSQEKGDSYEKSLTYLKHMQLTEGDEEIMYAFLDNTQNTLDTLKKGGVELMPMAYGVEYHSDWEGSQPTGGRSFVVQGEDGSMTTVGGGARLNEALVKACKNLGVEIITNTAGKKLITRRADPDGVPQVIGIVAVDSAGKEYRIKANRGVLLATGGFEWDDTLVDHYLKIPCHYAVSYSSNDGDGLRMVQAVGADLRLMNEFWGQAVYTKHGEYSREHGIPAPICCQTEKSVPGAILVDSNARRFCNEAADYDSHGHTMGGFTACIDNGWSCAPSWLIYDQTCYETYHVVGKGQDTLAPLEKGPFRAISVSPGCLGTRGGPRLNKHAQAVHVEGEPIVGLYAMGNCSGVGSPGMSYGGAGGTIGPAFVMGVIAAQHAAARTDVTDKDFFVVETASGSKIELKENEYLGEGSGISGPVKVKITVENGKMTAIEVVEHSETVGIGDKAVAQLPQIILDAQSADVDVIAGATITSKAIISAVKDAMSQAGL